MNTQKFRGWDHEMNQFRTEEKPWFIDPESGFPMDFKTMTSIPEKITIQRSTGLFDKNGVEIYEGDIIESSYGISVDYVNIPFEVKYGNFTRNEYGKYPLLTNVGFYYDDFDGINPFGHTVDGDCDAYTVVGNIFENPELL